MIRFRLKRHHRGCRFSMYVRSGVGIWGRDLMGAYEWNVEVGIRYMFGSF